LLKFKQIHKKNNKITIKLKIKNLLFFISFIIEKLKLKRSFHQILPTKFSKLWTCISNLRTKKVFSILKSRNIDREKNRLQDKSHCRI
jgi:hypothetical protein